MTGNELANLAGRFYAQAYAVVRRMVDEGLVVRAEGVGRYDPGWRGHLEDLARQVETLSGNPVRLIEVDQWELADRAEHDSVLIKSLHGSMRQLLKMPSWRCSI